jgi:glycosyltransferase involved in cell wall biosynthesis
MENEKPLISIIVPCYNTASYLPACVERLRKQTYKAIEIVLIDDGSKDETPRVCDDLAKEDPRITVIHQANGGAPHARNVGIAKAKGSLIAFCDSDDSYEPAMLEKLCEAYLRTDGLIPIGQFVAVDDQGKTIAERTFTSKVGDYSAEEYYRLLWTGEITSLYVWISLYPKALLLKHPFREDLVGPDDIQLLYDIAPDIKGVSVIPDLCYRYLIRSTSQTRNLKPLSDDYKVIKRAGDSLVKIYPSLKDAADYYVSDFELLYLRLASPKSPFLPQGQYHDVWQDLRSRKKRLMKNPYAQKKRKALIRLVCFSPRLGKFIHRLLSHSA